MTNTDVPEQGDKLMKKLSTCPRWGRVLLVLMLAASSCSGGSAETPAATDVSDNTTETAEITAGSDAVTVEPAATPEPTSTAGPSATPVPEPTVEPTPTDQERPLIQAEAAALEYSLLITEFFNDPLNMDVSRMIQLEPGPDQAQPMSDWTLRALAALREDNRYQPSDETRKEVIDTRWAPEKEGGIAWVDICVQTSGVWLDIDTDEPVMNSHPDAFVTRYEMVTNTILGTVSVGAIDEDPEGTGFVPCEFTSDES